VTDDRPLGLFDSGVGGLTVLRAVHDLLPNESTIYVGDLAHFPFGPRPRGEVVDRATALAAYFVDRNVKALVVACNTATSAALSHVERAFPGPVVGVVRPGAEEAVRRSPRHSIGVVATEGTVRSHAYARAIEAVCSDCRVTEISLGELVDLVESGQAQSEVAGSVVSSAVFRLIEGCDCDTIVLGCTHFPLVRRRFEWESAGRAVIVDSATSTASELAALLEQRGLLSRGTGVSHEFLSTAYADTFVRQARVLFGEDIQASVVEIPSASEPIVLIAG